jgi:hypothetical protein
MLLYTYKNINDQPKRHRPAASLGWDRRMGILIIKLVEQRENVVVAKLPTNIIDHNARFLHIKLKCLIFKPILLFLLNTLWYQKAIMVFNSIKV